MQIRSEEHIGRKIIESLETSYYDTEEYQIYNLYLWKSFKKYRNKFTSFRKTTKEK